MRSTWTATAFSGGVGVEIPIGRGFYVEPYAFVGYTRLKNKGRFTGPVSRTVLQPALSGLLVNWTVDAFVYGGSLALGYKFSVGKLDVHLRTRATHTEVEAFNVNGAFGTFRTSSTSIRTDAELVHPLPLGIYGRPLSLVVIASNTTFIGPNSNALDFTYYFEGTLALQYDLTGYNLFFNRIRIGATGIWGPNITGYSILMNLSM